MTSLTYKDSGVDIDAGNALVERIKPWARQTHSQHVLGGLGGFAGAFALPEGYQKPILVSATDGVGTKLRLAIEAQTYDGLGADLVAMCANDLITIGAKPLFFLDYYATGQLDVDVAEAVVKSIAHACIEADMALVGGETAEMPGMYQAHDFDLAGFCVGVVEKDRLIDGSTIQPGDQLIALPASGPHANGYSLIRRVLETQGLSCSDTLPSGLSLKDALLAPTRIYVKTIQTLLAQHTLKGMAHITGGGLTENLPRMLPQKTAIALKKTSWALPPVFQWLQDTAQLDEDALFRTFNAGIGFVCCVSASDTDAVLKTLKACGESAWVLGDIIQTDEPTPHVHYVG